eukprot:SM000023S07611  [mRNA]  locus=s23:488244:489151:+ [translate_table: standard]
MAWRALSVRPGARCSIAGPVVPRAAPGHATAEARTCRRCKQVFDAAQSASPCRYHPALYTGGERGKATGFVRASAAPEDQLSAVLPGGPGLLRFWDCCGAAEPDALGCCIGSHVTYDSTTDGQPLSCNHQRLWYERGVHQVDVCRPTDPPTVRASSMASLLLERADTALHDQEHTRRDSSICMHCMFATLHRAKKAGCQIIAISSERLDSIFQELSVTIGNELVQKMTLSLGGKGVRDVTVRQAGANKYNVDVGQEGLCL